MSALPFAVQSLKRASGAAHSAGLARLDLGSLCAAIDFVYSCWSL